MTEKQVDRMRAWESAEISRSGVEARLTQHATAGRLSQKTLHGLFRRRLVLRLFPVFD